jgi:hypothetical protein
MSMAKKRPQLELDELRQLRWLLGNVLVLIALSSLLYFEISAWLLLVCGATLVPLVTWRPALLARVPSWGHRIAFPLIVAFVVFDMYAYREPLAAAVRLDVLLLLYRCLHYRRRRDDLQLIVLGLLLIVMAGVVTVSMAFSVQIISFVACTLLLLFVVTLVEGRQEDRLPRLATPPAWATRPWPPLFARIRETCDWRVFALGALMFVGFVAMSGILFMSIPRFQLESGLALDRLMTKGSNTGFSDTMRFTDVTDIQKDNTVVLRIEASDRAQVPTSLYWRMVVMDEYSSGTFRMSADLKKAAFARLQTMGRIDSFETARAKEPLFWTFYLEPGVGRYLALGGAFRQLVFAEPKQIRWSPSLRLIALEREPSAMTAYRVEGMATGARMKDFRRDFNRAAANEALMTDTGVGEQDDEVLRGLVSEITGSRRLSAGEFAETAMLWLARRHGYSLKMELPSGGNDPLVRWLASKQPGHCELFAGGFVLLARAAGYPARVVAGFMGGAWNDDYLVVRNSDAHAWCEIRTEDGDWLRVDPTNDGPRLLGAAQGLRSDGRNVLMMPGGWAARIDRLRMLWYRRVVNFDRNEQQQLIRSLKDSAESIGASVRDAAKEVFEQIRSWLAHPWSPGRLGRISAAAVALALVLYYGFKYGRRGWFRLHWRRGAKLDPMRHEAGKWLVRWNQKALPQEHSVRSALLRIRYGRRESWPEADRVFREARKALRQKR